MMIDLSTLIGNCQTIVVTLFAIYGMLFVSNLEAESRLKILKRINRNF